MSPILYCWNFTQSRAGTLDGICSGLGIRLRRVAPSEAELAIASLPERAPAPGLSAMPFRDEMLLMAFFPDALLDRFLAALRANSLSVPRKAPSGV